MERKTTDPIVNDAALTDFGQAIGLLMRRFRAMSDLHGLSWTQANVMARLDREGPATTADLARAEGIKPQSMGTIVSTLEDLGFVERTPHPTDGRQMHIGLTDRGVDVRRSTRESRWQWLAHVVGQLDERERQTLFAAGEIIKRLVKK